MKGIPFKAIAATGLLEAAALMLYLYETPPEFSTSVFAVAIIGEFYCGYTIYKSWQDSGKEFLPFFRSNISFFNSTNSVTEVPPRVDPIYQS